MIRELIVTGVVTGIALSLALLTWAVGLDDCWPVWICYGFVVLWFLRQLDKQPT